MMMLLFRSSGSNLPLITTWHRICPRVPSQVKNSSTYADIGFLRILLIPHTHPHIETRTDAEFLLRRPDIVGFFPVDVNVGVVKS